MTALTNSEMEQALIACADLLPKSFHNFTPAELQTRVLEAYRRGRKSK